MGRLIHHIIGADVSIPMLLYLVGLVRKDDYICICFGFLLL